jgi:hypothetical protein
LREDPRAAFDVPVPWQCHRPPTAMQPPPSVYVSELSRRGLARRRARVRRRALLARRLLILLVCAAALVIAVVERATA